MQTNISYSLEPVNQNLSDEDLLYLLRRCLFGVSFQEYTFFKGKTLDECIQLILTESNYREMLPQEDPDVKDPLIPIGSSWINAPYENEIIDKRRRVYLKSWWVGCMLTRDYSITEKMVLFWHNHFVTEFDPVGDARYSYRYVQLLRKYALGNTKKLIKEGTTNPAMLMYLNGNSNVKGAPNENYSRELLELFTIGKYNKNNYTETDVKAAARVLTGWKCDKESISASFFPELHDSDDKTFSSFFDNHVIRGRDGASGASETDELINLIFRKQETAMFICRNLYRWFVSSTITDDAEQIVITSLADIFTKSNFEIKPVLKALLTSKHFFDPAYKGCIVKSPVDYFVGVSKQMNLQFPDTPSQNHLCWIHYNYYLGGLSQFIGDPPSVAGWPAYYQPPKYHQWWINSYTLGFRKKIIESLSSYDGMSCNGPVIKFDFIAFVSQFDNSQYAQELINNCFKYLLSVYPDESVKNSLLNILDGSGKEAKWESTWSDFIATQSAISEKQVTTRLQRFFIKIFTLPEYQMI